MLTTLILIACSQGYAKVQSELPELKKELNQAKKELSKVQARIIKLEEMIAVKEIQRIEEEIGKINTEEHSSQEWFAFFSSQRETLASIIQNYPLCATQAQGVLDQILILITHLSDEAIDEDSA